MNTLDKIVQRSAEAEERKAKIELEGYKASLEADDKIDARRHTRKVVEIIIGTVAATTVSLVMIWTGHVREAFELLAAGGAFSAGWYGGKASGKASTSEPNQ